MAWRSALIRCHINAFRYFGGYPEEILYDNMKQVVVKRLLKQEDSTRNSQFEDFAGFYGFRPILCRPYRGQTKSKVERTVAFVRDNFMTGIKYDSLENLNQQVMSWSISYAGIFSTVRIRLQVCDSRCPRQYASSIRQYSHQTRCFHSGMKCFQTSQSPPPSLTVYCISTSRANAAGWKSVKNLWNRRRKPSNTLFEQGKD